MAEGKAGRPKVLLRRHVIEVKKETRVWVEGLLDTVTTRMITGKGLETVGRAARGVLSHPAGILLLLGAWLSLMIALRPSTAGVEKDEQGLIVKINKPIFMAYARNLMGPIMAAAGVSQEDTDRTLGQLFDIWEGKIGQPLRNFLVDLFEKVV